MQKSSENAGGSDTKVSTLLTVATLSDMTKIGKFLFVICGAWPRQVRRAFSRCYTVDDFTNQLGQCKLDFEKQSRVFKLKCGFNFVTHTFLRIGTAVLRFIYIYNVFWSKRLLCYTPSCLGHHSQKIEGDKIQIGLCPLVKGFIYTSSCIVGFTLHLEVY